MAACCHPVLAHVQQDFHDFVRSVQSVVPIREDSSRASTNAYASLIASFASTLGAIGSPNWLGPAPAAHAQKARPLPAGRPAGRPAAGDTSRHGCLAARRCFWGGCRFRALAVARAVECPAAARPAGRRSPSPFRQPHCNAARPRRRPLRAFPEIARSGQARPPPPSPPAPAACPQVPTRRGPPPAAAPLAPLPCGLFLTGRARGRALGRPVRRRRHRLGARL